MIGFFLISINNVFAQIETANQYGTLAVEQELYEIPPGESTQTVKIFGKVEEIQTDFRVNIMITSPDGLSEGSKLIPTKKGFFETYLLLDENSQRGRYEVFASYERQIIGSVFFNVQDQELAIEELEEARQTIPTEPIVESEPIVEPEPIVESEPTVEPEPTAYEKGLSLYQSGNYKEALSQFKIALNEDPTNQDTQNYVQFSQYRIDLESKCPVGGSPYGKKWFEQASECCVVLAGPDKIQDCQESVMWQQITWERETYGDPMERSLREQNEKRQQERLKAEQERNEMIWQQFLQFSPYVGIAAIAAIIIAIVTVKKRNKSPKTVSPMESKRGKWQGIDTEEKEWEGI